MAVLFNKESFINSLLQKGKELGLEKEVREEIKLYEDNDLLEYLFLTSELIKQIKEKLYKYPLIRMAGGTSLLAYILGIHSINPIKYNLSNRLFFERYYKYNVEPHFVISVPESLKEETVRLLAKLVDNYIKPLVGSYYRFGRDNKYQIAICGTKLLERHYKMEKIEQSTGEYIGYLENKEELLNYILEEDSKGYYLPNLAGVIQAIPSTFYNYMAAAKPHNIDDLAYLISLNNSVFKDEKLVIKSLKENGIEGTICSKEQALNMLISYDIDPDRAMFILDTIKSNELFDSDLMLLESNEVPSYIIEQLKNIHYLAYLSYSLQEVKIIEMMMDFKRRFLKEFVELMVHPFPNSFVGPFFFIKEKIIANKDSTMNFSPSIRFFNDPTSHLDFFDTLHIRGDYGYYPRGRVLFDNFKKKFIVYLDKDLNKKDIKQKIISVFNLEESRTVFKRDSHYTHDKFVWFILSNTFQFEFFLNLI